MSEHRERIKDRIRLSIQQFKDKLINFNDLGSSIQGNISALDNLDRLVENAVIKLCGRLEIIHYTVDSDKEHQAMLDEISKFEPYIDRI